MVDDFRVTSEAINLTLEKLGKNRVDDTYQREKYERDPYVFYQKLGVTTPKEDVWKLFNTILNSLKHPDITNDVRNVLSILRSRGFNLSLISASPSGYLKDRIKKNNLSGIFNNIIGNCHDKIKGLKSLNLNNAAFVGDTFVDMEAGNTCNLKTIALLGGYNTKEQLTQQNPDHIITNLKELLELL